MDEIKKIYFRTREDWRCWLEDNHINKHKVAVIRYKKHTGKPSPSHLELMHDAICFGWIDTTVKRIDDEKYLINFSKRTKNSRWSENTFNYARQMIKEKKMSEEGMKHFKYGLTRPILGHGIPKDPKIPKDLMLELKKDKTAFDNFKKLSLSARRPFLRWLLSAKQSETRKKRVEVIVKNAKENKKQWN